MVQLKINYNMYNKPNMNYRHRISESGRRISDSFMEFINKLPCIF